MTEPLREHIFLMVLAVVVGLGTVMLLISWAVHVAYDALEDYLAECRGEPGICGDRPYVSSAEEVAPDPPEEETPLAL